MYKNTSLIFIIFSQLFVSCQLLSPYRPPLTPTPQKWKSSTETNDVDKKALDLTLQQPSFDEVCKELNKWWEIFDDPYLNQLEEQALQGSYSLWAALERVVQARFQAEINRSFLFPSLNFAPSFSRTGSLIQNPLPGGLLGGTAQAPNPANPCMQMASTPSIPNLFRFVQTQFLVPLALNYEIDLWYKLDNNYYAALMRAQAASQAYLSVLLSLTADIASHYFQLRSLDAQIQVVEGNIRIRQRALTLNQSRYRVGMVAYLDVSRAELEVARAQSDLDDVRRLRDLEENALATLAGVPSSIFSVAFNPIFSPPPIIPSGLPSELLCRRPDIGEAERNLAAAYREIGVAYANFFPSLNLKASLGKESPIVSQLFSWQSRFWSVGWDILQTLFDGGRTEANFNYYKSLFRESMANYQERVLTAFREVEDALANIREYGNRAKDLDLAVLAARKTLELSQERYNRGLINYLDIVDAERSLIETEQNAAIVLGNRYSSTVLLIRSLGGGW